MSFTSSSSASFATARRRDSAISAAPSVEADVLSQERAETKLSGAPAMLVLSREDAISRLVSPSLSGIDLSLAAFSNLEQFTGGEMFKDADDEHISERNSERKGAHPAIQGLTPEDWSSLDDLQGKSGVKFASSEPLSLDADEDSLLNSWISQGMVKNSDAEAPPVTASSSISSSISSVATYKEGDFATMTVRPLVMLIATYLGEPSEILKFSEAHQTARLALSDTQAPCTTFIKELEPAYRAYSDAQLNGLSILNFANRGAKIASELKPLASNREAIIACINRRYIGSVVFADVMSKVLAWPASGIDEVYKRDVLFTLLNSRARFLSDPAGCDAASEALAVSEVIVLGLKGMSRSVLSEVIDRFALVYRESYKPETVAMLLAKIVDAPATSLPMEDLSLLILGLCKPLNSRVLPFLLMKVLTRDSTNGNDSHQLEVAKSLIGLLPSSRPQIESLRQIVPLLARAILGLNKWKGSDRSQLVCTLFGVLPLCQDKGQVEELRKVIAGLPASDFNDMLKRDMVHALKKSLGPGQSRWFGR